MQHRAIRMDGPPGMGTWRLHTDLSEPVKKHRYIQFAGSGASHLSVTLRGLVIQAGQFYRSVPDYKPQAFVLPQKPIPPSPPVSCCGHWSRG